MLIFCFSLYLFVLNKMFPYANILHKCNWIILHLDNHLQWMVAIEPSKINLTTQAHANLVFWAEMGTEGLVTGIMVIFYDFVLFWICVHSSLPLGRVCVIFFVFWGCGARAVVLVQLLHILKCWFWPHQLQFWLLNFNSYFDCFDWFWLLTSLEACTILTNIGAHYQRA